MPKIIIFLLLFVCSILPSLEAQKSPKIEVGGDGPTAKAPAEKSDPVKDVATCSVGKKGSSETTTTTTINAKSGFDIGVLHGSLDTTRTVTTKVVEDLNANGIGCKSSKQGNGKNGKSPSGGSSNELRTERNPFNSVGGKAVCISSNDYSPEFTACYVYVAYTFDPKARIYFNDSRIIGVTTTDNPIYDGVFVVMWSGDISEVGQEYLQYGQIDKFYGAVEETQKRKVLAALATYHAALTLYGNARNFDFVGHIFKCTYQYPTYPKGAKQSLLRTDFMAITRLRKFGEPFVPILYYVAACDKPTTQELIDAIRAIDPLCEIWFNGFEGPRRVKEADNSREIGADNYGHFYDSRIRVIWSGQISLAAMDLLQKGNPSPLHSIVKQLEEYRANKEAIKQYKEAEGRRNYGGQVGSR